uniref:MI domain-containing protein n=2 Tax=Attheya septentrionalis TaxID=420275 RepID=A0A7S2UMK3_9STRA|mmetsp:Transcript_28659/g.52398  ORF Transcript_28659/g.52398 Transcript_28659/m.52398 type:complete len:442 (+) Transcript_28659:355-1680(+)|eukprot:CAMPEP_0198303298 /NCGR_PEP_ID=MMETSP1449-20131203/56812_1 /TAXON_ID=420275 /ORGANISM="Attheya septentrionalis, Strain CCMP2084" /LENGTH=441 /DNA_ID=CAMNT_0044005785 /DNA_START=1075 /DNA_END=2400 /DNA_ORIENTATION=+
MADFAKRPEVTVSTMGKLHNPTGAGVPAISNIAKVKSQQVALKHATPAVEHDTVVKEEGSARRNITRKKSDAGNFDSQHKKQGGHGKGKWRDEGVDESEGAYDVSDPNDPLYDDTAEEGKYILTSPDNNENEGDPTIYDPIANRNVYGPMLTLTEFKIQLDEAIKEYFDSADVTEVIQSLSDMRCLAYHPHVVKRAVSLSLDKGPRERELISRLLTELHPDPLTDANLSTGFELLLNSLDDLSIDIPDARPIVGCFLARAVVDEVVPPAFLSNANNTHPGELVIEKAVGLLSREHCNARLERIWGPGDGRPVAELKTVMDQLLKEYLQSRELDEAARCVREMNAPHFHHELVKRGIRICMEMGELDAMAALFSFLVKNAILSEHQVAKGISRLYKVLGDITLDVPSAPSLFTEFEAMIRDGGCFPPSYVSPAAPPVSPEEE